jgi:uncharacterized protein (TIGR03067 family)
MRVARSVAVAVGLFLAAGLAPASDKPARPADSDKEAKKFRGSWKVVGLMIGGEQFTDDEISGLRFVFKDGVVKSALLKDFDAAEFMSFRVDGTTTPKLLDLADWEKGFEGADEVVECVYTLDGDTLKLCFNLQRDRPARGDRPTALESKEGSNSVLITLKREKR